MPMEFVIRFLPAAALDSSAAATARLPSVARASNAIVHICRNMGQTSFSEAGGGSP